MTPQEFIAAIAPAAQQSAVTTRIPASFTIAEGALESGWGSHAPGRNLFGVKADPSWTGEFTTQRTREVFKGKSVMVDCKFRSYPDWLGSIQDHAVFLTSNPRYTTAFLTSKNVEEFAHAIAAAGYATDPIYADKIIALINYHNLTQYDKA